MSSFYKEWDESQQGYGRSIAKRRLRGDGPPPVEARPKCAGCGKPRVPRMVVVDFGKPGPDPIYTVEWQRTYLGYGNFCTLRCARRFADAAFKAGFRLKVNNERSKA